MWCESSQVGTGQVDMANISISNNDDADLVFVDVETTSDSIGSPMGHFLLVSVKLSKR